MQEAIRQDKVPHGTIIYITLTTIIIYLTLLAFAANIKNREWYVDENIFIPTIQLFYEHPTLETLKTYPEIPGPLTFVMYAAWAKLVGFSTFRLRLFSIAIAAAVFFLIFSIVKKGSGSALHGYLAMLLCMANPYMAGLSIFVFTDMAMLLFMLLTYKAVDAKSPVLVFLFMACALLCRQYAGIMYGAIIAFSGLTWLQSRQRIDLALITATLLSMVPMICLFLLWGGIAPKAGLEKYISNYDLKFGSYLVFYTATWWIYLLPAILWKAKTLFNSKLLGFASLSGIFIYPFFPVTISEWTKADSCYTTNGYVHRIIRAVTGEFIGEHILFALLFCIGLYLLLRIGKNTLDDIRQRRIGLPLLSNLMMLAFLCLMPLQYQVWEKYLVMILPFMLFGFFRVESGAGAATRKTTNPAAT